MLQAIVTIANCSAPSEPSRPTVSQARKARQEVQQKIAGPGTSPSHAIARIMVAYPALQEVMELSRQHILTSIEDDAATASVKKASDSFQAIFSELLSASLRQPWVESMAKAERPFKELQQYFQKLSPLFAPALAALEKWSASGLQSNVAYLAGILNDVCATLDIGKYMLVRAFKTRIGDELAPIAEELDELTALQALRRSDGESNEGVSAEGGGDGAPMAAETTDPPAKPSLALQEFAGKLENTKKDILEFANKLEFAGEQTQVVMKKLFERGGSHVPSHSTPQDHRDPTYFIDSFHHAVWVLEDVTEYIWLVVSLHEDADTAKVISFVAARRRLETHNLDFNVKSAATQELIVTSLIDQIRQFAGSAGQRLSRETPVAIRPSPIPPSFPPHCISEDFGFEPPRAGVAR